ncbi:hypothetical protein, partial [Delftia sp. ASV31]|uniref:hypothetical protein n=1 Tax=Delftia sp. ASV31 TaxID=2795113 RepID=UPI0018EB320B
MSVRSNLFIKPNGWGSCFLDPTPPLSGSENLLESSICPKNATETRNQTEFQQAWIEYAEDGTPHDIWQKAAILHWIKNHKGPLHVLVYVHGWHNNADDLSNRDPRNNAIKFAFMASR